MKSFDMFVQSRQKVLDKGEAWVAYYFFRKSIEVSSELCTSVSQMLSDVLCRCEIFTVLCVSGLT